MSKQDKSSPNPDFQGNVLLMKQLGDRVREIVGEQDKMVTFFVQQSMYRYLVRGFIVVVRAEDTGDGERLSACGRSIKMETHFSREHRLL